MRVKAQSVLSWIVVGLVLLVLSFPIRGLIRMGLSGVDLVSLNPTLEPALPLETPSSTPVPQMPTMVVSATLPASTAVPAAIDQIETAVPDPETYAALPSDIDQPSGTQTAPYRVQVGSPKYLAAFSHAELGCNWLGLAGQVFDFEGRSRAGLVVFATGAFDGRPVNQVAVTGNHSTYGPGGYEIFLSGHLPSGSNTITVQLYNLEGQPLSEPFALKLPTSCDQNLIMMNFQASFEEQKVYLPITHSP